jgi:hypothetical protein
MFFYLICKVKMSHSMNGSFSNIRKDVSFTSISSRAIDISGGFWRGPIREVAAAATFDTGTGSEVYFQGGSGGSTTGTGGSASLMAGSGGALGTGGDVNIMGGSNGMTPLTNGGHVNITGGNGGGNIELMTSGTGQLNLTSSGSGDLNLKTSGSGTERGQLVLKNGGSLSVDQNSNGNTLTCDTTMGVVNLDSISYSPDDKVTITINCAFVDTGSLIFLTLKSTGLLSNQFDEVVSILVTNQSAGQFTVLIQNNSNASSSSFGSFSFNFLVINPKTTP